MELVTKPGHQAGQFDPESMLLSLLYCLPLDIGMCVCSFLFPSSMLVFPFVLWSSLIHSPQSIVSDIKYKSYHVSPIQWLPFPISCWATPVCSVWSASLVFVQVLRCSVPSPAPVSLHSPFFCLDSSFHPSTIATPFLGMFVLQNLMPLLFVLQNLMPLPWTV